MFPSLYPSRSDRQLTVYEQIQGNTELQDVLEAAPQPHGFGLVQSGRYLPRVAITTVRKARHRAALERASGARGGRSRIELLLLTA